VISNSYLSKAWPHFVIGRFEVLIISDQKLPKTHPFRDRLKHMFTHRPKFAQWHKPITSSFLLFFFPLYLISHKKPLSQLNRVTAFSLPGYCLFFIFSKHLNEKTG
jgi:hypothetical protein